MSLSIVRMPFGGLSAVGPDRPHFNAHGGDERIARFARNVSNFGRSRLLNGPFQFDQRRTSVRESIALQQTLERLAGLGNAKERNCQLVIG